MRTLQGMRMKTEYITEQIRIDAINDTFEKFEMNESLNTELKKLEPVERQIVELRFLQNKSQTEVGKILGVNQMFISRAERKIIKKLKEALS